MGNGRVFKVLDEVLHCPTPLLSTRENRTQGWRPYLYFKNQILVLWNIYSLVSNLAFLKMNVSTVSSWATISAETSIPAWMGYFL